MLMRGYRKSCLYQLAYDKISFVIGHFPQFQEPIDELSKDLL